MLKSMRNINSNDSAMFVGQEAGGVLMDFEQLSGESASVHYMPFVEQFNDVLLAGPQPSSAGLALFEDGINSDTAVEDLIPYSLRSHHGIFFTPEKTAELCADICATNIAAEESFFDPACGTGNLLYAIAQRYTIKNSISETLVYWGRRFGGCDINESFVHVAKLRLVALAARRHNMPALDGALLIELLENLSNFHVADYLGSELGAEFDCIVANPPFGHRDFKKTLRWSSGRTQLASVFVSAIVSRGKQGQKVVSILPDVLKSGTRYARWREMISEGTLKGTVHPYGKFSASVDVDVFIFESFISKYYKNKESVVWVEDISTSNVGLRLGEFCTVNIGPVVPHRLKPDSKNKVPYICVKTCPPYKAIKATKVIGFDGTLYSPPFVVVRRTSNPGDKHRIITTLVLGKQPIAVENHLIIIRPNDGYIKTCKKVLGFLKTESAVLQINAMIRCRHLTKHSISSLMIVGGPNE
ncbi:N-6 DNA methylase [Pseudomonas syringae]|uniref:N-6 DNA methylase n=1 Tax=Pseudomonas syringae TaxID=317 RepID=UPI0032049AD8